MDGKARGLGGPERRETESYSRSGSEPRNETRPLLKVNTKCFPFAEMELMFVSAYKRSHPVSPALWGGLLNPGTMLLVF
jgi:hypothetical protein